MHNYRFTYLQANPRKLKKKKTFHDILILNFKILRKQEFIINIII